MEIQIEAAQKHQALSIARLIMVAMNYDCCRNFMGPDYTLNDFERVMTELVLSDKSQYSYRNTLVALDHNGGFSGMCVSYDGKSLHELRPAFVRAMKENFGRDFSNIPDETSEGELYIDSIAVPEMYRGKGVATDLLKAVFRKARSMGIPAVGLLVDKVNPNAEHLYLKLGFKHVNDAVWGGHEMRHLQYRF
ncbi:MAG: GNAT family N-acetyltransferase [Prevotellaceae bacterium]|nr:GNAT family N-acetyltransferase [Prevotellaceae bacterium]